MKFISVHADAKRRWLLASILIANPLLACGDEAEGDAPMVEVQEVTAGLRWSPGVETIGILPTLFNDGVSLDRRGRLFVSNAGQFGTTGLLGTTVYRTRTGTTATPAVTGLNGPIGSVSDRRGNLFVSNFNDGTIVKRDRHGATSVVATLPASGGGLAFDRWGRLYAASYTGSAIYRVGRDGHVSLFSDDPLLAGPVGISFDRRNRLYVGNYDDAKVLRLAKDGAVTVVADLAVEAGSNIGYVTFSRGCIFATSLAVNKIFAISPNGQFTELAGTGAFGSVDGDLAVAQFALPNGIVANRAGTRLFVSEYGSPNVRAIRLPFPRCPH